MRTIILAAGAARRLQPLTDSIPKTLLQLGEKTILEHILNQAVASGLTHFDIVTGHGHPAVEEFANEYQKEHPEININLIYNDQYDSTGNVASMHIAKEVFDEDFILINSDTIFHADILKRLVRSSHANAMVIDDVKDLGDEEMKVHINDDEHITHIHKSLDPNEAHGEYVGILKLSSDIKGKLLDSFDKMITEDDSVYYEDAIQKMINDHGVDIKSISTEGLPVMEIDTHEDLDEAKQLIEEM